MKRIPGIILLALSLIITLSTLLDLPVQSISWMQASDRPMLARIPDLPDGSIDVNAADAVELQALPGVGETLAQAIIDERISHGPFFYPEDLISVRGIGPSKLCQIRPYIDLHEGE